MCDRATTLGVREKEEDKGEREGGRERKVERGIEGEVQILEATTVVLKGVGG